MSMTYGGTLVLAPQGKETHGFHCPGQPSRANLVPRRPKMAKIAPQPRESGECKFIS
jgi:hypothetical protein